MSLSTDFVNTCDVRVMQDASNVKAPLLSFLQTF